MPAALRSSLLCTLLVIGIPAALYSQIAGGLGETNRTDFGGRHSIVGRIFLPSGEPATGRIRIRLASSLGPEVVVSTDDSGKFIFTGLSSATYTVYVDEDDTYATAREQVDIALPRNAVAQSFAISLRLAFKDRSMKAGVVRTENADVPKKAMSFYRKALELSKLNDHSGAIEQLKLAVTAYPNFMIALTEMGVQYMMINDLPNAEESLKAALKINADAFEPNVNQGIVLVRAKRYVEAERFLRAALKVKEGSAVAQYYLGRALAALKRWQEAESALKAAIQGDDKTFKEAYRVLASVYYSQGNRAMAAEELETYLKVFPDAPDAANLRAMIRELKAPKSSSTDNNPDI